MFLTCRGRNCGKIKNNAKAKNYISKSENKLFYCKIMLPFKFNFFQKLSFFSKYTSCNLRLLCLFRKCLYKFKINPYNLIMLMCKTYNFRYNFQREWFRGGTKFSFLVAFNYRIGQFYFKRQVIFIFICTIHRTFVSGWYL